MDESRIEPGMDTIRQGEGVRNGMEAGKPEVRTRITFALGAAFVALIAVVIVLVAFGRQTQALRMELADLVEPANATLLDLQRVLALQMAAQRGYRLGDAEISLANYRKLLAEEREGYRRLAPLAHAIGPAATTAFSEMRESTARWHEAVERPEPGVIRDGLDVRLSLREGYFAAALTRADRLGHLIEQAAERRRATIASREEVEGALIVAMVLFAIVALAIVARVGRRLHAVTLEAERMAAVAQARQADLRRTAREKASFMRGITHDLKNPLGVIDGSAELLEIGARGPISRDQREMTARIRRAVS
ncbi:MAG: histidine kinase dimerization/phospho-acceptor domain-containing protein, partial [Longimicrobiales bacterium]